MNTIHLVIASVAGAGTIVGIGWSALIATSRLRAGAAYERFQAAVVAVLLVGAASGLALLASGARPVDGLHFLYAIVAIGLVPLARSFVGRQSGRASALLLLVAFVVLGGVVYRLFVTG